MVQLDSIWQWCWHLPVHLWPGWAAHWDTGTVLQRPSAILEMWGPVTDAARPSGDTWHTGLAGAMLLWHFLSALCPSYMHRKKDIRCTMSCMQIGSAAVLHVESDTHFLRATDITWRGHHRRCCCTIERAWPVMRMFAVSLSLPIITSHWHSVQRPAAKPIPSRGFAWKAV